MYEEKSATCPHGTSSAEVVQVIKTTATIGSGTHEDALRVVTQFWSFDGNLLAENDPGAKSL